MQMGLAIPLVLGLAASSGEAADSTAAADSIQAEKAALVERARPAASPARSRPRVAAPT